MKIDYPAGDTGSLSTKALMQLRQLILTKAFLSHSHAHTESHLVIQPKKKKKTTS